MLFDPDVVRLVRAVRDGTVTAVAPLLDRLAELNDPRRHFLASEVGRLCASAQDARAGDLASWKSRSPEERAYRRDRHCRRAWITFHNNLANCFWAELSDTPGDLGVLASVEADLRTVQQATRLREDDREESHGGEFHDNYRGDTMGTTAPPFGMPSSMLEDSSGQNESDG